MRMRYAMIGGGEGAFIGAVHRMAARLDGRIDLVAGAFSRDPDKTRRTGVAEHLDPARVYDSYQDLFAAEAGKLDFISIVTPNDSHAPIAIAALEAGFDVLCDKPMADTLAAAQAMRDVALKTGRRLGITHTYTGYPMIKQARALVADGVLGDIRRVTAAYTQDWLSRAADTESSPQAAWRTDPARSGEGGAFGDIGTHAFNLAEYVTGVRVSELNADIRAAVAGRVLDDDGSCLLRFANGARGTLTASQVCTGDINALTLSVYGETAALHWAQEDPNRLRLTRRDGPEEIWTAGANRSYLSDGARAFTRVPAGHPEGYIEAFANIYRAFADNDPTGYASPDEALSAMRFVHAARRSSELGGVWTKLEETP